jgi:Flp pilus assembly secretin CpaC
MLWSPPLAGELQMKRLVLLAALLLPADAIAQTQVPKETRVTSTVRLQPGEVRILTFDQDVTVLKHTDAIIQVVPESDRSFSVRALSPGTTLVTAFDRSGTAIYRANLVVPGGFVRVYGTNQTEGTAKDFAGYICSENGCSRTDVEVDKTSSSGSVSVSRRNSRGELVTTTRNY